MKTTLRLPGGYPKSVWNWMDKMENVKVSEIISKYYRAVWDAYSLGNVESSYNAPIMTLFTNIGCAARDMSGERKGQSGENIDIKLWHAEEEVTETDPFAGVEVKKVGGIDKRALSQIKIEADIYGNAILTDNTFNKLTQYLSEKPEPIEIFDYVYGVLHDPVYCEKYEQYLCRDFPRVPIINTPEKERD